MDISYSNVSGRHELYGTSMTDKLARLRITANTSESAITSLDAHATAIDSEAYVPDHLPE